MSVETRVIDTREILSRNDFQRVPQESSTYHVVHRSPGPPVAEIHMHSTAHLVLPEAKLATRLPDSVLDSVLVRREGGRDGEGATGKGDVLAEACINGGAGAGDPPTPC